jgi:hypothetical protein
MLSCCHAESEHDDVDEGRRGSVAWYKKRADKPVYPGSHYTVREVSYFSLLQKRTFRTPDTAFNTSCKFTRELLAGACQSDEDNLYPPSAHIMKGIVGAEDWSKYEVHYCDNPECDGFAWDHLPRAEWAAHEADTCDRCGSKRFNRTGTAGSGGLEPAAYFIYFGLENVIKNKFFTNPDWTANRGKQRDTVEWLRSPEALRMAAKIGDAFFNTRNGFYELGIDWIQPFNSLHYSIGNFTSAECAR